MILRISNFHTDIMITDEYVRTLEVENKILFANIIQTVYSLCNNQEGNEYIVLDNNGKNLDFAKKVYFVIDILNTTLNEKKILNNFFGHIKALTELDTELLQEITREYRSIYNKLNSILADFPFEFYCKTDFFIDELLAIYKVRIIEEELTIFEKLLNLIDLISLLGLYDLVILGNIKSFLTIEQLEEVYKHILYNKQKVLLIENARTEKLLNNERKVRINANFEDYEVI